MSGYRMFGRNVRTGAVVLLVASTADAETIADEARGFRIDLDLGAHVCIEFPEGRAESGACDGLDVKRIAEEAAKRSGKLIFAATVESNGWTYDVAVRRIDEGGEISENTARGMANDVYTGIEAAGQLKLHRPPPPFSLGRSNGIQVLTIPLVLDSASGDMPTQRVITRNLYGANTFFITTTVDEAHAADVDATVERGLSTLALPAVKTPEPETAWRRLAFAIFSIFSVGTLIYLARKRARTR